MYRIISDPSYAKSLSFVAWAVAGAVTWVAFQNGEVKQLLPSTRLNEPPWASASTLLASLVRVTTLAVLVIKSVRVQTFGSPACQVGSSSGFSQLCRPIRLHFWQNTTGNLCSCLSYALLLNNIIFYQGTLC